jgi:hypothetical protein
MLAFIGLDHGLSKEEAAHDAGISVEALEFLLDGLNPNSWRETSYH